MQCWIEKLPNHLHPSHTLLLHYIHQLLVEPLVTAVQRLSFFTFGIELLPRPFEIVHDRKNSAECGADQLLADVVLVTALAFSEIIEIRCDPHVLTLKRFMLLFERVQLLPQLLQSIRRISHRTLGDGLRGSSFSFGSRWSLHRLNGLILG